MYSTSPISIRMRRRVFTAAILSIPAVFAGGFSVAAQPAATSEKIIISGASGQLGELTTRELLRQGFPAKNLILVSRTPEKLKEFSDLGASARYGDVDMPESLPGAYAGGTRMLMISLGIGPGAPPRPPRHKLAFDAAVKAGVRHIVYTSFIGADKGGSPVTNDHMESEKFLMSSGAKWTALRNGAYADMTVQRALQMAQTGKANAPPNESKSAPVTREDCAAAAASALLGGAKFENQAFDITGPALVGVRDIAKLVGDITGKTIEVTEQAEPARGGGGGMGGLPPLVGDGVSKLTGRPATSLRSLLEANRAALVAAAAKG
jgi:NAD(P)H dehydrogenase (quinone)